MKFNNSQIATEYIVIMGLILVVTIPLLYYAMRESNINIQLNQANDAVLTLARAADTVYSIGPGTRKYVWINMPGGVQAYSLENKTVLIKLYAFKALSDVFAGTKADLAGIVPISRGEHRIKVEMLETGYVQFGDADDTEAPNVIWTYPSGTINFNGIVLRATTDEHALCKYDETDTDYSSMSENFVGSALTHEKDLGILDEGNYTYFVRCQDPSGNIMEESAIINFMIVPPIGQNETNETPQTNETYEAEPPDIKLIRPINNYVDNDSIVLFEYNVTDNSSIWFCQLIINTTIDQSDFDVTRNITQNFTRSGLDFGNYTWNVNCSDVHGNRNSSLLRNLTINYTQDHDLPIVQLIAPPNNTIRNYWLIKFMYNVTDITSGISYCELNLFGLLDLNSTLEFSVNDEPITEGATESITLPLMKGDYSWNVSCVDNSYLSNRGYSKNWWLRINISAGEEAFLDSCAGICGYNGYGDGACENTPSKCNNYCADCYYPQGDQYCIGGPEADTCCCIP